MTDGCGGGPPQEAYGRVTHPERYLPLHAGASDLLDRLTDDYSVERSEGLELDEQLSERVPLDRIVRLMPTKSAGAPLTVGFSRFPGLFVRYGRWDVAAYPHCGCDACDENVDALVDEVTSHVALLVRGEFQERLSRRRLDVEFGDSARRWSLLDREQVAKLGRPGRSTWGPWRRRDD